MTFRDATPADVDAVVALVESAYRGDTSRRGWTTEADLLDGRRTDAAGVAAIVADPHAAVLLAEDADGLLACCELRPAEAGAYFGMFAVDPGRQGRGVGRRLLAHADAEAVRRHGAGALEMTVIVQRTDLIAWYLRLGFAATGERKPFPHGDERFGRPRRDDLEFVVLRRATTAPPA
nr:GNAT family N-acetyltransferase [Kineococcus siccus]